MEKRSTSLHSSFYHSYQNAGFSAYANAAALSPLRFPTDERRRKGKVFVSQQLPLKLLLATNVEGIYFLFRNGPQIAIM